MTTEKPNRLGPLYRRAGLNTPPDLIRERTELCQRLSQGLTSRELAPILLSAFGLAKTGDNSHVENGLLEADSGLVAGEIEREVTIMSAGLLGEAIELATDFGKRAALGISAASLGGIRSCAVDSELVNLATSKLALFQQSPAQLAEKVVARKKPNLDEQFTNLQTHATSNSLNSAHDALKAILTANLTHSQGVASDAAAQLNAMLVSQRRLQEQMAVHWWVLGGWSQDTNNSFSELPGGEVAIRAGRELAGLTISSELGVFAAPALLEKILTSAGKDPGQSMTLQDVAVATPIAWRRELIADSPQSSANSLLPLSMAINLATEADDAGDWVPRFERMAKMAKLPTLRLIDVSYQMYLECLAKRLVYA